jgi:hypothetical protein
MLQGTMPEDIGQLRDLEGIWVQNNELTGDIPQAIILLTKLTLLALDYNRFTGGIPDDLGELRALRYGGAVRVAEPESLAVSRAIGPGDAQAVERSVNSGAAADI